MGASMGADQSQQAGAYRSESQLPRSLNADENRIAQAVIQAVNANFDLKFAEFEINMQRQFTDHMTEIESYYSQRDRERDETVQQIKQDMATD